MIQFARGLGSGGTLPWANGGTGQLAVISACTLGIGTGNPGLQRSVPPGGRIESSTPYMYHSAARAATGPTISLSLSLYQK